MNKVPVPVLSVVVPVYGNADGIAELIYALRFINDRCGGAMEAVLVVDGSPDDSLFRLREALPAAGFRAQLLSLSRNFGAFSAIRVGLEHAGGECITVMAADLQEPPELALQFQQSISAEGADIVFGVRVARNDPWASRLSSGLYWWLYRRLVLRDVPAGGVDVFAVNQRSRDRLLAMRESHTSLLAQLFWLGGRRAFVPYERRARQHGKSAWTLAKKLSYMADSVFAFTDLPVRLLIALGIAGLVLAVVLGSITLVARLSGWVDLPGYTGTLLTILFFGALNALGLGVVGTYAWRAYENTKARPLALVQSNEHFAVRSGHD